MSRTLRRARLLVALFAVAFAVFVAFAFKDRPAAPDVVSPPRLDPSAIVESTGGVSRRFTAGREDGSLQYGHLSRYSDGTALMDDVTIVSPDRGGHSYTITAEHAQAGKDESEFTLTGNVQLESDNGLRAMTDEAVYTEASGAVRAAGLVSFAKGRLDGTGLGMTYDTRVDVMTLLAQAEIHVAPDEGGVGSIDIAAGRATFPRADHVLRLERGAAIHRDGREILADSATALLSDDEERLTRLELRGDSSVTTPAAEAGALRALTGRDIDLQYAADGEQLEKAHIDGDGAIQFAGAGGRAGRRIEAATLDVELAPDGTTPVALTGQRAVRLSLPADGGRQAREIDADDLDATGAAGRGLTSARFTGRVTYREHGDTERVVNAGTLDATLAPDTGEIQDARFARAVHVVEGALDARAAAARYRVSQGVIELTGAEPGIPVPNVVNEQIDVRGSRIDVTLDGPQLHATSAVKSVLKPASASSGKARTRLPAMLDESQPVTVTADDLQYDGTSSRAVYTGHAWLWQGDTSVKGDTLTLDGNSGDLSANGSVTSTTLLDEKAEDGSTKEVMSVATAKDLAYDDRLRRATYTGEPHVSGPSGDMTANRIELFLAGSGDTLDRLEAYEAVTLRENQRKTTGARLTYTAADERYVVTGAPATIVDECGRETVGQRISFLRASDTVTVDGGTQRATTRGGNCTTP